MRNNTKPNLGAKLGAKLAAALLTCWATLGVAQDDPVSADWLFIGDHIITMQPEANPPTALAVKGSEIYWLGQAADANAYTGPNTKVVELGERALLPGFIDAHGHLSFQAATINTANVASPPVGPVADIKSLQATLRAHIKAKQIKAGDWVTGVGYDDSLLATKSHPTRRDLDAVSQEHPIALMHVSGHLIAANSQALKIAGINADTLDPKGGHIRRFADSAEPNGVLEETATYKMRPFIFGDSEDPLGDLRQAQNLYASHGITTAQDGAASEQVVQLMQAASAADQLIMDVVVFPVMREPTMPPAAWKIGQYQGRAKVGGVKLVLDGSPQGKTAFLSKPYAVPPDGKDATYRGYPTFSIDQVEAMVGFYLKHEIPMLAHANGDAAGDMLIQAVEKALGDDRPDHRTVMIHAQAARMDQLDDMAELGIIPSFFSAHVFYWGDWHRDSVFGVERATHISATRSAANRDIRFTIHNDAPIVPPNMLRLLWATTNRLTRSGRVLGESERLTTFEALKAITVDAARQAFEEERKGTLAKGKLADLTLLSKNPLQMPASALEEVNVLGTWSHGQRIFTYAPPQP